MTAKKKISRTAAERKDGKKGPGDQLQRSNMTAKHAKQRDSKGRFLAGYSHIHLLNKNMDYTKKLQRMMKKQEKKNKV